MRTPSRAITTESSNPPRSIEPTPGRKAQGQVWAIVLAGGEGRRLRPLIRRLYGEDRPKQYAALWGSRSMLRHTLDRVGLTIPLERTAVVTLWSHARYIAAEFPGGDSPPWVLVQPEDRGTAAGVLFPAHWISWRDPGATVVVFPSDHFILDEAAFMAHVMEVAAFVERHPERLVLLGAQPTAPVTEYGWIDPGEILDGTTPSPIFRARAFREKPPEMAARDCFDRGWLWNTLVFVTKVETLLNIGRQLLPVISNRLGRIVPFAGTEDEPWAIQQAYALAPKANFSRAVLEACPDFLAVSQLPDIRWNDCGTPDRVFRGLRLATMARHVPRQLECSA